MEDESDLGRASTMMSSADEGDLRAGMVLNGTYRLVSLLGQGGMGEVWKADHLRLPKHVAIKVLLSGMASSEEVEARFRREAEIGSRLAHPHIVHVFDFNELPDGRKYIAMDFLEGESLADRMERGAIPYAEVVAILKQTAQGLQVAHEAGVVHRDLKPDNIFLSRDATANPPFRVKILDFGISKIQNAERTLTQDMAVMGTPGYMAPEQARGQTSALGPEADQFSLATIAYEMVSGSPAFEGQTLVEIIFKLVHEDPKPIDPRTSGVPDHVARALSKAMAKEPTSRFKTIGSFVESFAGTMPDGSDTLGVDDAGRAPVAAQGVARADSSASTDSGQALPVAAPDDASQKKASRTPLIAGVVIALLGVVFGGLAWQSMNATDAPSEPIAQDTGRHDDAITAPIGTVTTDKPVALRQDAAVTSDAHVDAAVEAKTDAAKPAQTEVKPTATKTAGRAKEPALSPEATALVKQAEAALASGDGGRALTLAERAFRAQNAPQARAAMAKAHCLKRDRGASNAAKRGLPTRLSRAVDRFCDKVFK